MAVRLSIDITDELHEAIKIHIARTRNSIKDFTTEAIKAKLFLQEIPQEKNVKGM